MEERIWHKAYSPGVPHSIEYEEIALPQVLTRMVEKYPNVAALILMGKTITYRELHQLVDRFAAALVELGVKKGDRVSLILPNIPQMVIATYVVEGGHEYMHFFFHSTIERHKNMTVPGFTLLNTVPFLSQLRRYPSL